MTAEAEEYRRKLREMLPELAKRFGVAELGLFGSRVRGDHRPDSDLDVLVSFAPDASLSLLDVVELEYLLSDRLGVKVDLALKRSLKRYLRPYILREVQPV
jgi:predicted nucleotidyltransferase